MFEESVCLLLRAAWFNPLIVESYEDAFEYNDDDENEDDLAYVYLRRQDARPVLRPNPHDSDVGSSSREPKKKEAAKDITGRRAKRTLKREAADKAAAAKHEQRILNSLGH
ncbi:uncharacterized protein LOC126687453 [Mercurialis annua]|uniref:uncharacterized protein LOC126687453 n=1 Tax=Mercurialis annua TaxID=3986 RepID=UPI002160B618|nr:uncharacterized protein LOC126687453 [Mercurialis annua]